MRCEEIGIAIPEMKSMINEYCSMKGFNANQCDVLAKSVVPAYPREVCTYFGWLPGGDVERAESDMLFTHETNVNDGCQSLRDELLYGGEECDSLCDVIHNSLNNITVTEAPSPNPNNPDNEPISNVQMKDTTHDDAKDTSATGLKKGTSKPRNPIADVSVYKKRKESKHCVYWKAL